MAFWSTIVVSPVMDPLFYLSWTIKLHWPCCSKCSLYLVVSFVCWISWVLYTRHIKEARYKITQNDRFSWKKSRTNISLWWFLIYQNDIRLPCYFFCYMHFKVAWNSILALKSVFIYDVIISCLKAWYTQLTSKNWFFSKDNYFYLHNSHISVNCNW